MTYNNCPIVEQTADGKHVGRCWAFVKNEICPRHGNVSFEIKNYKIFNKLTLDTEHIRVFPDSVQPKNSLKEKACLLWKTLKKYFKISFRN